MSWRTIIISTRCKLDYKMGYMYVRAEEIKKVFLDEVAILMIENPAVSFTGCLMEALIEKKIKVIFCDTKRSPISELVPYHGCHNSSERIRMQMTWDRKTKDAAWQKIISRKIENQQLLLLHESKEREAELLGSYIRQIVPGDKTNREGHAAKVYFNALFGMDFSRGKECPINAALNYGYGILLSAFNREVAASGYITQIGIFHDNMFNHFNLTCDLVEPFRTLVDQYVVEKKPEKFDREEKRELWGVLHQDVQINGRSQTVLNAIKIYCKHFFDAMNEKDMTKIIFLDRK